MSIVSVCLPSDALLQHLPSYLGFSYLGRGVSLHGCSSKAQLLLLTLDEGYLLTAALPVLSWHGGLACWDSWGRKESDTTEWLNWTELFLLDFVFHGICSFLSSPIIWHKVICTQAQGKRNPSKMVGVARGHQRADTLKPYSQKSTQSNHTRTTVCS